MTNNAKALKIIMTPLFSLFIFIILACQCVAYSESKDTDKTIFFVSASNDYPISYVEPSGNPKGLLIDLMNSFCRSYGYKLQCEMVPADQVYKTFQLRGDIMYDAGASNPLSTQWISEPFYYKNYMFFSESNLYKHLKNTESSGAVIGTIQNLSKTIGIKYGYQRELFTKRHFPQGTMEYFKNDHDLLKSVNIQQMPFVLMPKETGYKLISELGLKQIRCVDQSIFIEDCALKFSEQNVYLLNAVNKYIEIVKNNGELKVLTDHYFDIHQLDWRNNASIFGFNLMLIAIIVASVLISIRALFLERMIEKKSKELIEEVEKQKTLTNQLLDEEQFKNAFFINTSHELRTPISAILNSAQLSVNILEKSDVQEAQRLVKFNNIIENNGYRLLRVINNIIDVNRIENGQLVIYPDVIDIIFFMEELIRHVHEQVPSLNIQFKRLSDDEEVYIQADPQALERILINLISNTIKFSKEPVVQLSVAINHTDQKVYIKYCDCSAGFSQDQATQLFKKFATHESSLSKSEGYGLGLYIVSELVKRHQGNISYEANRPQGVVYTICLPQKLQAADNIRPPHMSTLFDRVQYIRMELSELYKQNF